VRVALFSDVHGNLRGLDACLDDLAQQGGADLMVGAGDYCMDGPRPREVLERLAACGAVCVRGNTDRWVGDASLTVGAAEDDEELAQLAWQREQLGPEWTRWLGALPFAHRIGEGGEALLVVHANPQNDEEHIWPDAADAFLERITAGVAERAIAFGHLHLPYVRLWRDRLFVDVASAGLPKDGDPRAGYAILTQRSGGWEVKLRRVPFDVDKVVKDIEKSGMPGRKKRISVLRRHRYKELNGPASTGSA
jgi:predicted phosphodiesterase